MRVLLLLLLFSLLFQDAAAQQIEPAKATVPAEVYTQHRNTYNTVGWVLLGTGVALASYSFYDYAIKDGYNGTWDLEPLFNVGGVMVIASVPFFIVARHNKLKARLALKGERFLPATVFVKPRYLALSLQINW